MHGSGPGEDGFGTVHAGVDGHTRLSSGRRPRHFEKASARLSAAEAWLSER